MQLQLALISRQIDDCVIYQRAADGYINATAMCKAVGKHFHDYSRLASTQEFLEELSRSTGIPVDVLVYVRVTGLNEERGAWVHPDVAVHLAQWCSAKFAVAVARWVREWMEGKKQPAKLPYHLERYLANRHAIPTTHFSMLNEMVLNVIAPMEELGYRLPDSMLPDISTGRMFCNWLRKHKGFDTSKLPKYRHIFDDSRIVEANLYPLSLLEDFRAYFFNVWIPERAADYFKQRDPEAVKYLSILLPLPDAPPDERTAKIKFEVMKSKVAAARNRTGV